MDRAASLESNPDKDLLESMADPAASSSSGFRVKRKSKGQQCRPMKKIENKSNLVVTFCKRRAGLFKKASELCILCGVQMAIILFSPANKPYAFGHPSVDSVVDQFLAEDSNSNVDLCKDGNDGTIERLCTGLDELKDQVTMAEKRGEILEKIGNEQDNKSWRNKNVEEMNLSELLECKKALVELTAAVPACSATADPPVSVDLAL